MRRGDLALFSLLLILVLGVSSVLRIEDITQFSKASSESPSDNVLDKTDDAIGELFGNYYFENVGQIPDSDILYFGPISGGSIGISSNHFVFWSYSGDSVKYEFVNANPVIPTPLDQVSFPTHFIISEDRSFTNIRGYTSILYENLWPGIDLYCYTNSAGIKYEFHLSPHASPNDIDIRCSGVDNIQISDFSLTIEKNNWTVIDTGLCAFQEESDINVKFKRLGPTEFGYSVGVYDSDRPLVIDPLVYATYLGGSGADYICDLVVDNKGAVYVAGWTNSTDLPVISAYDSIHLYGSFDGMIFKINPDGETIEYCTYLGENNDDVIYSIDVDTTGNVYIAGETVSGSFPITNGYDETHNGGSDCFIAKLGPNGDELIYSTFLGGEFTDFPTEIVVDNDGYVYVTGITVSPDFPTVSAFDSVNTDYYDAFLTKFSITGDSLIYSTYIGGNSLDEISALDVDSSGNVYILGNTRSTDFPLVDAYDDTKSGGYDIFLMKMRSDGYTPEFSTLLGGLSNDYGGDIVVDTNESIYIVGSSGSDDYPVLNAYSDTRSGGYDIVVSRFSSSGDEIFFSTYLGGTASDFGRSIAVDTHGYVYVVSGTYSTDFPTLNSEFSSFSGVADIAITKLNTNGSSLNYSSYYGGSSYETGYGALGPDGFLYIAGSTQSSDIPLENQIQGFQNGGRDGFLIKLDIPGRYIPPTPTSTFSSSTTFIGSNDFGLLPLTIVGAGVTTSILLPLVIITYRKRRKQPAKRMPLSRPITPSIIGDEIKVSSGIDTAGENLKVGVKVSNTSETSIIGVIVTLDAPEGLEFTKDVGASMKLGSIAPGGFQSAIFWLKPLRCIDDSYSGTVMYQDARGGSHVVDIPRKRLVNVCPMLVGTESPQAIFTECKFGTLVRNSASFKFQGSPGTVFQLAKTRVASLIPSDLDERNLGEEGYMAYTCVVGKTKYGDSKFAAEIQVSGNPAGGVLTLHVYSDDERILSGFFVDIMTDVRQHVEILEETSTIRPTTCPNCNAPLDLSSIDESRVYECKSCGTKGKVPPWFG